MFFSATTTPCRTPGPSRGSGCAKPKPKDCINIKAAEIYNFVLWYLTDGHCSRIRGGQCSRARPPLTRRCGDGRIAHRRGAHCSTGRTSGTSTLWQQGCPSMPGSRTQFPERDGRRSTRPRQPPALPYAASTAQASARGAALAPLGCAHHCCWRAPAASKPKPEFLSPPHPTMTGNKKQMPRQTKTKRTNTQHKKNMPSNAPHLFKPVSLPGNGGALEL